MRISLSVVFRVERKPKPTPEREPQFEHRDLDTLVETPGPQRVGFTVPHGAEPLDPNDDRV